MSKANKGNPYRSGHIVVPPPGMAMPPESGLTPFWEKELGLLYVSNNEAAKVNLSIGQSIRFQLKTNKRKLRIAYNISNP